MDYKANLLLVLPINFYNVCVIYPPSIEDILSSDPNKYNELLVPYSITKDLVVEEFQSRDLFEILFINESIFNLFLKSLEVFCKTKDIKVNFETCEIFIDNNNSSLNKTNFDEFSEIILFMLCREKIKKEEEIEPIFRTAEGEKRWLKLQEMRKNNKSKQSNNYDLASIINIAQLGTKTYISEELIKTWSLWKLVNTYTSILHIDSYVSKFSIYLQTGSKELVEKHWSDMIKMEA